MTNPAYRYFNIAFIPLVASFFIGSGPLAIIYVFLLTFVLHATIDNLLIKFNLESKIYRPRKVENFENHKIPLYLTVPLQLFITIMGIMYPYQNVSQTITGGVLLGIGAGIMGVTAGHELIHAPNKIVRKMGSTILYAVNYPHFKIEHMWHHLHLCTDQDTDSAKRHESVYQFILRTIPYGWYICWKWEAQRLNRKNKSALSLDNKMLKTTLKQITLNILIYLIFGLNGLIVFLVQGIVSIILLKWVDYIEHYGISRKLKDNGRHEAIERNHSWDSASFFTNFTLFNLGYHGHHHESASVPYYHLEVDKDATNTLPHGYTTLMLKALIPSHWYQYMDPFLVRNGQL